MIAGILMALAAGALVSIQNLFNSKVNLSVRSSTTTALVLGMGFASSLSLGLLFEGRHYFPAGSMQPWFWFSGLLGIGVVTCVVRGVDRLGASHAISIVMASQLVCAMWWDSMGWFGLETVPLTLPKSAGTALLIGGLLLFRMQKPAGEKAEVQPAP